MRIVDIRELSVPISRYADPSVPSGGLTTSMVAVITDVTRDGTPIVGYGFASIGRFAQGGLIEDLQREFGLSYLFVAHDLAVVEHISHRIAVIHLGKIVEIADKTALFTRPQYPYTEALLSTVPVLDPEAAPKRKRIVLKGLPPSGCRFLTRGPSAFARCSREEPKMREVLAGHHVACHLREVQTTAFSQAAGVHA
jgi:oligopeptide/dipeptide ABC transporter ATP-binding protein